MKIFFKKTGEESSPFIYETDGLSEAIYFGKTLLWFSDEDEREFFEEKNEYEPLGDYLKKELRRSLVEVLSILDKWEAAE